MSDNVTNLDVRRGPAPTDKAKREIQRLHAILANTPAGTRGHVLTSLRDREAVALVLGRHLHDINRSGISNESVRKNGKNVPHRIERYTTRPEKSDNRKGLLSNLNGYLAIADAIATTRGMDAQQIKIEMLRSTNFWAKWNSSKAHQAHNFEADKRSQWLCDLIREMTASVIKHTGLHQTYTELAEWNGQFYENPVFTLLDDPDDETAMPNVPLLRYLHSVFTVSAIIDPEPLDEPLTPQEASEKPFEGTPTVAQFRLFREIRLAIAPVADDQVPGPAFQSRAYVDVELMQLPAEKDPPTSAPEKQQELSSREKIRVERIKQLILRNQKPTKIHKLIPDRYLQPIPDGTIWLGQGVYQVNINGKWHRLYPTTKLDDNCIRMAVQEKNELLEPSEWLARPYETAGEKESALPSSEIDRWAHWWITYSPLSDAAIQYWIANPILIESVSLIQPDSDHEAARKAGYFEFPEVARMIELSIRTGTLRKQLIIAAKEFQASFKKARNQQIAEARANDQALFTEWEKDSTEEQDDPKQ